MAIEGDEAAPIDRIVVALEIIAISLEKLANPLLRVDTGLEDVEFLRSP